MAEQGFPNEGQPFVDSRGIITQSWRQFLLALWERTGAGPGPSEDVLITFLQGANIIDRQARSEAQDAMLMALRAQVQAQNASVSGTQKIYMPMVISNGTCVIAPDGRLIPTLWGTL